MTFYNFKNKFSRVYLKALGLLVLPSLFLLSSGCSSPEGAAEIQVAIPRVAPTPASLSQKSLGPQSTLMTMAAVQTTAPYAPADVSGFDCLLVNVVGPGIGSWSDNQDRVSLAKNFSYIGARSNLISLAAGGEVTVKIKKGSGRFIQLIGVRTNTGLCPSSIDDDSLMDVNQFPGLFIVAATQKDIYKNEVIKLKSDYDVTTTSDIRGTESQPNPVVPDESAPTLPTGDSAILGKGTVSQNSIEISWNAATDNATLENQLKYKLVYTDNAANLLESDSDILSATTAMDWLEGQTNYLVTGLASNTTYNFRLLVKDSSGKISLYPMTTSSTLSSGVLSYSITYHTNNAAVVGSAPSDSKTYAAGATVTVMDGSGMTLVDNEFVGWNTNANGSGVSYTAGTTFAMGSSDINLYAQWSPVTAGVPTLGLLAYWQFEDTLNDSSVNANSLISKLVADGTAGSPNFNFTEKKVGNASVDLDTVTFYDSNLTILNSLTSFSVGGWIYVKSHAQSNKSYSFWGQNGIFSLGFNNSGPNTDDVCVRIGPTGSDICSPSNITLNVWHHIMITFASSGAVTMYVDGVSSATGTATAGSTSANTFAIGYNVWMGNGDLPVDAYIDDIIIYNRTLSPSEVSKVFTQ